MKYLILILSLTLSASAADRFKSLVNKFCLECHGGKKTKGGVNFKAYNGPEHIYKNYRLWEDVIVQVEDGEMPPEDEPQMSPSDKKFFLGELKEIFNKAETVDLGDPGPAPLRRLTRREYNNTIRDIFGVDLGLGKEFPSEGGGGEGFDNNAEVLNFSPIMFEKYIDEAGRLSRHLTFSYAEGFRISKKEVPLRNTPQRLVYLQRLEDEYKSLVLPPNYQVETYLVAYMKAAREAVLKGKKDEKSIRNFALSKKMNPVFIIHMVDYLKSLEGKNKIEKRYLKDWFALKPNSPEKAVNAAGKSFLKGYSKSRYINEHNTPEPKEPYHVLLRKVRKVLNVSDKEMQDALSDKDRQGLLNVRSEKSILSMRLIEDKRRFLNKAFAKVPAAKRKAVYAEPLKHLGKKDQGKYKWFTDRANKLKAEKQKKLRAHMEKLLKEAFRRTPEEQEINKMTGLFNRVNAEKQEQAAARAVLIRVFCSPAFIFRMEKQQSKENYRITDQELAVRLSYFLWSSKPDARLLKLAAEKKLSDKKVLDEEISRMLKDPRARALAEDFAAQWLKFRDITESVEIDKKKFPAFNKKLAEDMYLECVSTVEYIMKSDSSILNLLDSDYVFVNENLAKIYGIKGIKGSHFRKVKIADKDRGGLVTSPAIMTMTSYPLRTSPVLRGNYVISSMLGTPTPPPPENVEELPADDSGADGLTVKQRLEKHRENPQCAGCHSRIDPIGFPLEVFDPIGRKRSKVGGKPVDATGAMKGKVINGPAGLKKYLLGKEDLFLKNMASKLLGYSLGRSLEFFDRYTIAKAVKDCKSSNYKFSAMVKAVVHSKSFQYRRGTK